MVGGAQPNSQSQQDQTSLHARVEALCADIEEHNALLRLARDRRLSPQRVALFLYNTEQLIRRTPEHISRAITVATDKRLDFLLPYLAHSAKEEVDHHKWAERDQTVLSGVHGEATVFLLPAMKRLMQWLQATIDGDPVLLLAYILFVEYLTVRVGPGFVAAAQESGVPVQALTVISNHVTLDKDHVRGDFAVADKISASYPRYAKSFEETAATAAEFYSCFLTEVATFPVQE